MASPQWVENFRRNEEEVNRGPVRIRVYEIEVDEGKLETARCEYCGLEKPIIEIVRNFGICDHDSRFGHI